MIAEDYERLSASAIAALVNDRRISAAEITEAALSLISRRDPPLRAFHDIWPEAARAAAGRVDAQIDTGRHPVLAGVPVGLKAGRSDRGVQQRLVGAGCVVLGTTSVPGPGTVWRTWGTTDRGPTINPWAADRTPGGSSAGSAAAVAAGLVPLAGAVDGAGSTRIPAAWCGVYGLKPTNGRGPSDRTGLSAAGPIARSIGDIAVYLRVVLGCDVGDRTTPHRSLRAVWSHDLGYAEVDPKVAAIARAAAHVLSDTGAVTLTDGDVRLRDPAAAWTALRTPGTWNNDLAGVRADNDARLAEIFTDTDLLLTPTTPYTAHGHDGPGDALNVSLTWGFNLSGHPALTVPAGLSADGLPVGLQIVARHGAERDLLQAAARLPDVPAVPVGDP